MTMSTLRELYPLAEEMTALLKALSHPARLMICCKLSEGECSVAEMEDTLGIHQPRLSRELAKLREEGILGTRRQSKSVFYHIADERVSILLDGILRAAGGQRLPAVPTPGGQGSQPSRQPAREPAGCAVFATTEAITSWEG